MLVHLRSLLRTLAPTRPVFHSERDFQHALAWALEEAGTCDAIRLERPFDFAGKRMNVDLVARTGDRWVAAELKYVTRGLAIEFGGERFELKNQAAQDLARHDFWRDVVRLETLVAQGAASEGWAIFLTNDSTFWSDA